MNYLAITGVRMLLSLVIMIYAACAAIVLYACGMPDKALSSLVMSAMVCAFVRPGNEAVAAYMEFQRNRKGVDK